MLTEHVFKDTGIKVKIRKASPMLGADVRASIPVPKPPMNEVDYGEPRGKVLEENKADPAYQQALLDYEYKVYRVWRRALLLHSVIVEGEEWRQEVQKYRDFIQEQTGAPLDEPEDLVVYVLRICVGSEEDLQELIDAITRRSQPTQEAIDQAKESFRSPV